jgi:hypothetical protein
MEKMGFKETLKEDLSKQVSKHPMVEIQEKSDIRVHQSLFTMGL